MKQLKSLLFDAWCAHPCFLILILPSPLMQLAAHCRHRPSPTSMTFTMTFVCKEALRICIGRWCTVDCWHGLFGSMSRRVMCQLRRSSMWTMVLWDGLMICTGHPGIGRMTSGADEPCMTGPRRRRLHRHPELWKHQITAQSSKKLSEYLSTMRNVVKLRDRDDTQQNGIRW